MNDIPIPLVIVVAALLELLLLAGFACALLFVLRVFVEVDLGRAAQQELARLQAELSERDDAANRVRAAQQKLVEDELWETWRADAHRRIDGSGLTDAERRRRKAQVDARFSDGRGESDAQ